MSSNPVAYHISELDLVNIRPERKVQQHLWLEKRNANDNRVRPWLSSVIQGGMAVGDGKRKIFVIYCDI